MQVQNYLNSESVKKILLVGISLIFLAGLTGLSVILNWQFNSRIIQIENVAKINNQRLTDIENFLAKAYQAINAQQQLQQPVTEKQPKK